LIPILSNLMKALVFGKVNQGEDVLFEAATTKSDRTVQKFISNSGVRSNTFSNFADVRFILFTQDGN